MDIHGCRHGTSASVCGGPIPQPTRHGIKSAIYTHGPRPSNLQGCLVSVERFGLSLSTVCAKSRLTAHLLFVMPSRIRQCSAQTVHVHPTTLQEQDDRLGLGAMNLWRDYLRVTTRDLD